jgi:hypothetical protein
MYKGALSLQVLLHHIMLPLVTLFLRLTPPRTALAFASSLNCMLRRAACLS